MPRLAACAPNEGPIAGLRRMAFKAIFLREFEADKGKLAR